jgi:hypothetical protein
MDWRSMRGSKPQSALSLASTVRVAGGSSGKGWGTLAGLIAILVVRPVFYYTVGSAVNWTAALDFLAISIPFRSDLLGRMYLFSTLSFLKIFGCYYAMLLLFSAVNRRLTDEDRVQRFIRTQLGWFEKLPSWFKLLLPSLVAGLAWAGLALLFAELELIPERSSARALWGQSAAFALAAMLAWKWVLIGLFLVHLLNIYLYIGTHPAWAYIGLTSRKLLSPFSFLRVGKMDLSPVAGIVVVFAIARWVVEPAVVNIFNQFLQ